MSTAGGADETRGAVRVLINIALVVVGTIVLYNMHVPDCVDTTVETDYHVEAGDPGVSASPATMSQEAAAAGRA